MASYTKTSQFLLPVVDLKGNFSNYVEDGFVNAYSGFVQDDPEQWGKYLYLLFDDTISRTRRSELMVHPALVKMHVVDDGFLFCFKPSEEYISTVIEPFIKGQYSKISQDFASKYYPKFTLNILSKDEDIKKKWEEKIGISIPEGMEVWPKPEKEEEIYGYKSKSDHEGSSEKNRQLSSDGDSGDSRSQEEGLRSPGPEGSENP